MKSANNSMQSCSPGSGTLAGWRCHSRTSAQPAAQFIAVIGELYAIEAAAREMRVEQRLRLRHERSRPVLARIQALFAALPKATRLEDYEALLP